jgi:hypothetical protein
MKALLLCSLLTITSLATLPAHADEAAEQIGRAITHELRILGYSPKNVEVNTYNVDPIMVVMNTLSINTGTYDSQNSRTVKFDTTLPNTKMKMRFSCDVHINNNEPKYKVINCKGKTTGDFFSGTY